MSLLRTRGGGLLAMGPGAARANAMEQQRQLLGAARAPSIVGAPTNVIRQENPLNSLGEGMALFGKSLSDMAINRREKEARAAAQAAGNDIAALREVQRRFPSTQAGKTAGDQASRIESFGLRRDQLRRAVLADAAAATAAERRLKMDEAAERRRDQEFATRQENLKQQKVNRQRETALRAEIAKAIESGDMKKVAALQMMSSKPSIMQAGAQLAKSLGEPKKRNPFGGSDRAVRDELEDRTDMRELASLNNRLQAVKEDIKSGDLDFGMVEDSLNFVRNFTGLTLGDKGARKVIARNRYEQFIQKYVNDSLRLNKGVQTEGDAIRAIREIKAARDPQAVMAALSSLEKINNQAQQIRRKRIEDRRALYGMTPYDFGDNVSFKEVD